MQHRARRVQLLVGPFRFNAKVAALRKIDRLLFER
jgi:hypothetical protein